LNRLFPVSGVSCYRSSQVARLLASVNELRKGKDAAAERLCSTCLPTCEVYSFCTWHVVGCKLAPPTSSARPTTSGTVFQRPILSLPRLEHIAIFRSNNICSKKITVRYRMAGVDLGQKFAMHTNLLCNWRAYNMTASLFTTTLRILSETPPQQAPSTSRLRFGKNSVERSRSAALILRSSAMGIVSAGFPCQQGI